MAISDFEKGLSIKQLLDFWHGNPARPPNPRFGVPNGWDSYFATPVENLEQIVLRDPICRYIIERKYQTLKELRIKELEKKLKDKKPKRPYGGRIRAHNKPSPREKWREKQ